jgi:Ca2+/H+ antiporter, TMEM165/GDT1 family
MAALLASFFFVMAAEMGDKTQLVALAFATRYNVRTVLIGVTVATLLVHLFSVMIGQVLGVTLPAFWISLAAGLAFIGFGVWTLRGDKLDDEEGIKEHRLGPVFTVGLTFFLAELGDKTMLATITLSSQYQQPVMVWLGSTFGMVVADGLAVIVGTVAGKRLPERVIQIVAALIFIGTGLFTLAETLFFS